MLKNRSFKRIIAWVLCFGMVFGYISYDNFLIANAEEQYEDAQYAEATGTDADYEETTEEAYIEEDEITDEEVTETTDSEITEESTEETTEETSEVFLPEFSIPEELPLYGAGSVRDTYLSSSNGIVLGVSGTAYTASVETILNRVNAIRYEAYQEGKVSSYVPIKWSADLEWVARVRAAEADINEDHVRPNNEYAWTLQHNGVSPYAEVLAWNYSGLMDGIEQWYEEKDDYEKMKRGESGYGQTGHYEALINPNYKYIGIGTFNATDGPMGWITTAGEFGYSTSSETKDSSTGSVIQKIEVAGDRISSFSLSNTDIKLAASETSQLSLNNIVINIENAWGSATTYKTDYYYQGATFSSSNTSVATVNSSGKITAKSSGTATITVKLGNKKATCKVTVGEIYNGVDYSAVYNYSYYINKYSDVKKAYGNDKAAALKHFVTYGMKAGRQGSSEFNVTYYKNRYADLRNAYGSDLTKYYMHYINYGKKAGRDAKTYSELKGYATKYNGVDYSAVYNYNYYIGKYADIKKAYGDDDVAVLKHFVTYGMKGGRQGSAEFNVTYYKNRYADLRKAYGKDLTKYYMHYINYGKKAGRDAKTYSDLKGYVTVYNGVDYSAVYNYNYYVKKYADIKKAYGDDDAAVLKHFVTYGMKGGRQGSAEFNVTNYKNRYGDLRKAYGSDLTKYYLHYIKYGKKAGRNGK